MRFLSGIPKFPNDGIPKFPNDEIPIKKIPAEKQALRVPYKKEEYGWQWDKRYPILDYTLCPLQYFDWA